MLNPVTIASLAEIQDRADRISSTSDRCLHYESTIAQLIIILRHELELEKSVK